ncbi:MAG TPA: undecaprenyl-diphosphate phosphatase [bacterium]|nr:undecaprenyl-diphosphate phosphatase [bacterium]
MFPIIQSIIIGAIQGITEFLPISSSAHLVLVPYLFKWPYHGLTFDVALHFGTFFAIIIYFWKDWIVIIKSGFTRNSKLETRNSIYPPDLLWKILVASIPAAIVGLLIESKVEEWFHSPLLLAVNLAVFGLILWQVDKRATTRYSILDTSYSKAFLVGVAQSLALIPGVSRSGITIVASRAIGLSREQAARFSFLIGTPAILGAFLLQARKLQAGDITIPFVIGIVASTVFGILAIRFLLSYLKRSDLKIFFWYRLGLTIVIILTFIAR